MAEQDIHGTIEAQLRANATGLEWSRMFLKGEDLRNAREALIDNRIELKRIRYAASMNPAAAVFGQSQVGKSYLVDNLLQSSKGPLMLYDGHGKAYNFLAEINPLGGGKESTSLVSRFTTKKQWINDEFPVKAVLLEPVDVILTLCDTYFNDVKDQPPTREQIHDFLEDLKLRYNNRPPVQNYITEDELFAMRQYFKSGVLTKSEVFIHDLLQERFFETVAQIITSVDVSEWKSVFGILWNNLKNFNDVFENLIRAYSAMGFKNEVYIKMDALLREDGTILHVDRLYELFGVEEYSDGKNNVAVEKARIPDMEVFTGDKVLTLPKSAFCALTAELVLKVDDDLATEKEALKRLDLLDFPGARSRMTLNASALSNADACGLLIRGKVAYLFNKYSQQYLITNLLFCHHSAQSDVTTLSSLLEGWVHYTVGKTVEQRTNFMKNASVSPLFIIGTKFNSDFNFLPIDNTAGIAAREQRWTTRFNNLQNLIGGQAKWFNEWINTNEGVVPFANLYLLRSYDYSSIDKIFEGYMVKVTPENIEDLKARGLYTADDEAKKRKYVLNRKADGTLVGEQRISDEYSEHMRELEETFLRNDFVKKHFDNPKRSWDKAATVNNDGSQWIIDNLTIASRESDQLRNMNLEQKAYASLRKLCHTLYDHYHDDDADAALTDALRNAGRIDLHMRTLFGKDKYFFSEFIDSILIKEDEINDTILDTINSNIVVEDTDLSVLFAVRDRAHIDPNLNEEENRIRLRNAFHLAGDADVDAFLEENGITMEQLINPPKIRNLARIVVEAIEEYWFNNYFTTERYQEFIDRGLPEKALNDLLNNMKILYKEKLDMTERITARVQPYISDQSLLSGMAEMLADINAEMINKFVNTMGTHYFAEAELWEKIEETVAYNKFDVVIPKPEESPADEEANEKLRANMGMVFEVFDHVDTILNASPVDTEKLRYFSNYDAFSKWTDMMKVAFLATVGIPQYNIVMNDQLRKVLVDSILMEPTLTAIASRPEYKLGNLAKQAGVAI